MDLTKSMQTISSTFDHSDRETGEETEPFFHKQQPILDQMEASKTPSINVSQLSSQSSQAKHAFPRRKYARTTFLSMNLCNLLLFKPNIQARKINRWNTIAYENFHVKHSTHHEAASICIDHVKVHHRDLPFFMSAPQLVLNRIREIFNGETWCKALFEKHLPHQTPATFAELIKTAAPNIDDQIKPRPDQNSASSTYHIHLNAKLDSTATLLAGFFAKTPPLPFHLRLHRYSHGFLNKRGQYRGNRPLPSAMRKGQIIRHRCEMPGHILPFCPEKNKYISRLQIYKNIGTAGHIVMDSAEDDSDESLEDFVAFL